MLLQTLGHAVNGKHNAKQNKLTHQEMQTPQYNILI